MASLTPVTSSSVAIQQPPIGKADPNLLFEIFKSLSPQDLARASEVCRQWRIGAQNDRLWQSLLKCIFPHASKGLGTAKGAYQYLHRAFSTNLANERYITRRFQFEKSVEVIPSNNNQLVFFRAYTPCNNDDSIHIWDPKTQECVKTLKGSLGFLLTILYSQPQNRVISYSSDYQIQFWDFQTGSCLKTIVGYDPLLSDDGNRLIITSTDNSEMQLWDLEEPRPINSLIHVRGDALTFSSDGNVVIFSEGEEINIWETKTKNIKILKGHEHEIGALIFHKDKNLIISADVKGTIKIWKADSCDCISTLNHGSQVLSLKLTRKGNLISFSQVRTIEWNIDTSEQIVSFDDTFQPHLLILSEDEGSHIVIRDQQAIEVRNAKTGISYNLPYEVLRKNVVFFADGKLVFNEKDGDKLIMMLDFGASNELILNELSEDFTKVDSLIFYVHTEALNEALHRFERMPDTIKEQVFIELDKILLQTQDQSAHDSPKVKKQKQAIGAERGKAAFFNRSGSPTGAQRAQAILNYLQRTESK